MSEDSARAWDEQAKTFDEAADHGLSDPVVRAAWADLLSAVIPEPSAVVADLGCGTGSLSVLLASAGHQVTGVDFSTSMIEVANAKAAAWSVHAEFIVADAAHPPLAAGTFDVVLGRHVLWALPEPAAALAQWVQLLHPGGRLVLIEGRWSTGAGLTSQQCTAMVRKVRASVAVQPLTDPVLWGHPIDDERYLLVSPR